MAETSFVQQKDTTANPAPLGLLAMYTGLAQVLNELHGAVVLPLGPVAK